MKRRAFIAMLHIAICGVLHAASPTNGTLRGVVRDSTGSRIPGVTVELAGSQLPSARVTVTDSSGEFRFAFLEPAGDYVISSSLVGFETVSEPDIRVHLGRETSLNLVQRPAAEATVTVFGERPLVDVRDTSSSTNITRELFEALPTRRDFQYLTVLAPSVVFDAEWDPMSPRLGGATHLENDYIIEGVSTKVFRPGTRSSAGQRPRSPWISFARFRC